VFVVGSLNLDLVLTVETCPAPGETVLARAVSRGCGGKGANQAVSAARAGAQVLMVGCIGDDQGARLLRDALGAAGVDASGVVGVHGESGLAVVTVSADGENQIVVAPGANLQVDDGVVRTGLASLAAGDVVLAQAEIPVAAIKVAAGVAKERGARFVLNLAPPVDLLLDGLELDTLLVNQHEAAAIAAGNSPEELAGGLAERLGTRVVVTLGAEGVMVAGDGPARRLAAYPPVRVVDTTGAGDAFAGAFAAALSAGAGIDDAVRFGAAAGSLTVAAAGAQGAVATTPEALRAIIGHTAP
jgi:ribokinase